MLFSEKATGKPNEIRNKRIQKKLGNSPPCPGTPVNPQLSITDRAAVTVGKTRTHNSRHVSHVTLTNAQTHSDEHGVCCPATQPNDSRPSFRSVSYLPSVESYARTESASSGCFTLTVAQNVYRYSGSDPKQQRLGSSGNSPQTHCGAN